MRAIDVHVHPPTVEYLSESGGPFFANAFGVKDRLEPFDKLISTFKDAGVVKAVLLAWDAETHSTRRKTSNEYIHQVVNQYPDFFVGFGSVDPWKGAAALHELEKFRPEYGFKGVKFHPPAQGFSPADPRFFAMWDYIQEQELVVLSHAGHTGYGAGLQGGGGVRLVNARPFPDYEVLANNFPRLKIICAHPGWPWHEDLLALAMHKSNIYIDLSGWSPKYIPSNVIRHAKSLLQDKMLFGTDYPVISPQRWIDDLKEYGIKEEAMDKILYRNAANLLGIE